MLGNSTTLFSSHRCVGDLAPDKPHARVCLFENVCYTGENIWTYYYDSRREPPLMSMPDRHQHGASFAARRDDSNASLFHRGLRVPMLENFIDLYPHLNNPGGQSWCKPNVTGGSCESFKRVPAPVPWEKSRGVDGASAVDGARERHSDRVHVLIRPFWPENFGHALGDDIYPVYQSQLTLGLPPSPDRTRIILPEECGREGWVNKTSGLWESIRSPKACRFHTEMARGLSKYPLRHLSDLDVSPRHRPMCLRRVIMGAAAFGQGTMHHTGSVAWGGFVESFAKELGVDIAQPPRGQRIVVIMKNGRRQPRPRMPAVADHLRTVFPDIALDSVDMGVSPGAKTLRDQIKTMSTATVVLTVCGGGSMVTGFMPRNGVRIVIDPPTYEMESFLWNHDARTVTMHYPHSGNDVVPEDTKEDVAHRGTVLNLAVVEELVRQGLDHVARMYGWLR
jgi:hypothetical protein